MSLIKLQVKTKSQEYPIIIGSGALNKFTKLLNENSISFNQCLIVIDNKISKKAIKKILSFLPKKQTKVHYFIANEKNKNQKSVDKILTILLRGNFNRNDCLISVGGGITGDVSGFAASVFKRGLRGFKLFKIPCSYLSGLLLWSKIKNGQSRSRSLFLN